MKAVLASIRPQWCELIASGKKTVEVRKTAPKMEPPFKCYIYCTNTKPYLVWGDVFRGNWETEITTISGYSREAAEKIWDVFNGNVMGEFVCDRVFDICIEMSSPDDLPGYPFPCTGLTDKEILQYLGNGKPGYGWHISELKIYDEPKPLSDFTPWCDCVIGYGECDHRKVGCSYQQADYNPDGSLNVVVCGKRIIRAPQSWCYVEVIGKC